MDVKPFNCWNCAACCKVCHLSPELQHFDRGDGVCVNLTEDNRCAIYETRPDICNTRRQYEVRWSKSFSWNEYVELAEKVCRILDAEVNVVNVNIKKLHDDAVVPAQGRAGDAGFDLTATSMSQSGDVVTYGTGLAVEIPEGHAGFLFPRSSLSKYALTLCNHVGVVDSNYRGEIMLKFRRAGQGDIYLPGERVAQLVILPIPSVSLNLVDELGDSNRGDQGFGSSGR